jgi:hypothetical protein
MNGPDARLDERARLVGMMDIYLDALERRDPGCLRLAPDFRYTEDGQPIPLGSGTWRTIRDRAPGGHYFVDAQRGQVEYWGLFEEMGRQAMAAIRLEVAGRVLVEAETIVTRAGAFFDPVVAMEDVSGTFHAPLEPHDRGTREDLIAVANLYFNAIELSDGDRVPVRDDCRRLVNGVVDSSDDPARVERGEEHRALSVSQQITDGHYFYIEALRDRRFPIVDVERGLVLCHLLFDHPGDRLRPGGDAPIRSPNSMLFTEVFKIVAGRIEEIWALGSGALPYGSGSGW